MTKRRMTQSKFNIGFIERTIRTSGMVLLISFVFGLYSFGFWPALAFFSGGVWGIVNMMFLKRLIQEAFTAGEINTSAVALTALVKFPLLFVAGYFLVTIEMFDIKILVAGFSLILAVMLLKALGRLLLGLDNKENNQTVQKVI